MGIVMKKITSTLNKILDLFGITLFVLLVIVVMIEIFSRAVFKVTVAWTEELSRFLFLILVYISAAIAAREGANICIDILSNKIPPKYKKIYDVFILILSIAVLAVYISGDIQLIGRTKKVVFSTMPFISTAWQYVFAAFGLSLTCLFLLVRLVGIIKGTDNKEDTA